MEFKIKGEAEKITLSGEDYKVSNPYTLPKTGEYQVSVKPKEGKDLPKYVLEFSSKKYADVFRKISVNSISFYKVNVIAGTDMEEKYHSTKEEIERIIKNHNASQVKKKDIKMSSKDERELRQLESLASKKSDEVGLQDIYGDITADDDIDELLNTWQEYFNTKSNEATTKARVLLVSISNHYANKEVLDKSPYIKQKLSVQTDSLSMLFMQLNLTKQVLMKFFKEIMAGLGNKPIYDGFAAQQKMVLEINSFIGDTISEVIDDLKKAKERYLEIKEEDERNNTEEVEGEVIGDTIVVRNKSAMLRDLDTMIKDSKDVEEVTEEDIIKNRKDKEKFLNIKSDF